MSATFDRLLRLIRRTVAREQSVAVMRLTPANLGSLRLELDLQKDAVAVRIETHTELAHRLLVDDADRLRSGLQNAGVQLQRLEIVPPPALPPAERHAASEQRPDRGRRGRTPWASAREAPRAEPVEPAPGPAAEPPLNLVV